MIATRTLILALTIAACATPHRQAATPPRCTTDPADLKTFVDSVMHAEMQREGIPGAAFVYVCHGRVIMQQGYGVANVSNGTPVDPATTIWRIGSITKSFTATAVMQLVAAGKVNLDADANKYLKQVRIPDAFNAPVHVRDLLAHTAGFDEISAGRQAASRAELQPLGVFLQDRLKRIRPPGQFPVYSTYAIATAGALVEDVSGLSYGDYVTKNIFAPLHMDHTSFNAVSERDAANVAMGYERKNDTLEPQPWEWYHTAPASSINSTVADMAKYIVASLTHEKMLQRAATPHPLIGGVTLGFWEDFIGSLRVVEHGGNMAGFSAQLTMIPSEDAGFFVVNHFENSKLRDSVRWFLLEHLFPAARTRLPVPATNAPGYESRMKEYDGRYIPMTSCHTCTPPTAGYILPVKADSAGISVFGSRYVEESPYVFVQNKGTGRIVFRTDDSQRARYFFVGSFWSFEKVPE